MEWTLKRFDSFREMVEWVTAHDHLYIIHCLSAHRSNIINYRPRRKG